MYRQRGAACARCMWSTIWGGAFRIRLLHTSDSVLNAYTEQGPQASSSSRPMGIGRDAGRKAKKKKASKRMMDQRCLILGCELENGHCVVGLTETPNNQNPRHTRNPKRLGVCSSRSPTTHRRARRHRSISTSRRLLARPRRVEEQWGAGRRHVCCWSRVAWLLGGCSDACGLAWLPPSCPHPSFVHRRLGVG